MGEAVLAALVTGVLSLMGVLLTRVNAGERQRLKNELDRAQTTVAYLRDETEKYKAAYLGLLELTQGLLEEKSPPNPASPAKRP